MTGVIYCFAFQLAGIFLACLLFQKENMGFRLLIGSVMGSFLLHWLPALAAFGVGFTVAAHGIALIVLLFLSGSVFLYFWKKGTLPTPFRKERITGEKCRLFFRDHCAVLWILVLFAYFAKVLWHHTLTPSDGAYLTGQCTYGDMNMHLGFITSIAEQGAFPPEYSIFPGTKLAYPFLGDSISSSLYLLGSSLRVAYVLPMLVAVLQVLSGMYALAYRLLKSGGRAFLAHVLFFMNGGFGVWYFVQKGLSDPEFTRIFTEFYQTPTNYVAENIQWHNIIVDMLIPQRALLFGWAVLIPLLYLLTVAREEKRSWYFIPAGVLAGGLPLIHTHSFLALGVLCCGFLLSDLRDNLESKRTKKKDIGRKKAVKKKKPSDFLRPGIVLAALAALEYISARQLSGDPIAPNSLLLTGGLIVLAFAGMTGYYFVKAGNRETWMTWGIFLGEVLVLALPILFAFTFQQATGSQFTRGHFGWANSMDRWILFGIKNYGIMFFLTFAVLLFGSRKQFKICLPAAFLWVICEFVVFQPNHYDNNKLLLVSYLYFCIAAADLVCGTVGKFRAKWARACAVAMIVFAGTISAALTMAREYVSEYELYSKNYVKAAEWVLDNTAADTVILTATNHNNAIASLTGRNIVCGSSSFLYFHGLDYGENAEDVRIMYEEPDRREALFEKYGVKYILIGSHERGSYQIADIELLFDTYPVVFGSDDVVLLQVGSAGM